MTTIHITGAGGCIDNEVVIIAGTLRALGYNVQVDNKDTGVLGDDVAEFERVKAHMLKYNTGGLDFDDFKCGPASVLIKTTHIPWGG